MDLVSGFPKNLAYTLKQLANFTKQTVKVIPDRVDPKFGEISRFKLPASAMIDFRTISIYADVSLFTNLAAGDTNSYSLHLPRNTGSLIEQITITCNGVQLCNINDYNVLYNTLYDMEGADFSQTSKRLLENPDPSVYYYRKDTTATNSPIGAVNACQNNVNNKEVKRPIVINNFLGFISSLSTPVLDLNDTGDVYIEIRWASPNVLWASNNTGDVVPAANVGSNKFENLRMTCSKINFESGEYFNLKSQKLLSDGLLVGYYDYWTARGSAVDKSAGVSMNFNVSTNSLDQCIATFQKHDYQSVKHLVLRGAGDDVDGTTIANINDFHRFFIDIPTNVSDETTVGDAFNQSYYFMRSAADLATSQWSINSTNIDPYPLPPSEIWNQNLIALGNQNLDFGTSGVHAGCLSLYHFLKYYFCHILSLENLSGDGQFWRSGLSGNGSTINITYNATFDKQGATTTTEKVSPIIFCRSTKVLSIRDGHIISVV
jgi:hypothetical protein